MWNDNIVSQQQRVVIRLKVEVSDPNIKVVVKVDKVVAVKKYIEDKQNTDEPKDPPQNLRVVDANDIITSACGYLKLKKHVLLSKSRIRGYVKGRQMLSNILYNIESYTLVETGECLRRDHTTIGYLLSKHISDHDKNEKYKEKYNDLIRDLDINPQTHSRALSIRPNYKGKYDTNPN